MKYIRRFNEDFNGFKYSSDEIRYDAIVKKLGSKKTFKVPSEDEINASLYDYDAVFVYNRGDYMEFIEYWVDECWEALYEKPEYNGLNKEQATDLFVKDRFQRIADKLNMEIIDYTFTPIDDDYIYDDCEYDTLSIKLKIK